MLGPSTLSGVVLIADSESSAAAPPMLLFSETARLRKRAEAACWPAIADCSKYCSQKFIGKFRSAGKPEALCRSLSGRINRIPGHSSGSGSLRRWVSIRSRYTFVMQFDLRRFSLYRSRASTPAGWVLTVLMVFLAATGAVADDKMISNDPSGPITDIEVRQWVAQLGDADFAVRHAANRSLLEAGVSALPQLRLAVDHPDRELRHRARRLVGFLERLELRQQVDEFARSDDPDRFDMPCWPAFREVMGEVPLIQSLFAEMLRHEIELLKSAANETDEQFERTFSARLQTLREQITSSRDSIELDSLCAIYFCMRQRDVSIDDIAARTITDSVSLSQIETATQQGEYKDAVEKLVALAIINNEDFDDNLILGISLPAVIPRAKRVVMKVHEAAFLRKNALIAIATQGSAKEIPFLEEFFDDAAVCREIKVDEAGVVMTTTIGDIALILAIQLAGKDAEDFGIERGRMIAFADQDQRDMSRDKWKEMKQQQSDPDSGKKRDDVDKDASERSSQR